METIITLSGIIAGILFAYSGIPLAIKTIKDGHATHVPLQLALCVFGGAVLMLFYLIASFGFDLIVFVEYAITIIVWGIVLYYKRLIRK